MTKETVLVEGEIVEDAAASAEDVLETELDIEELLADLPELKPATRLRARDRNKVLAIIAAREDLEAPGEESGTADMVGLLDIAAEVDEFAESIAVDRDAYVAWAEGANYRQLLAILSRYGAAVGESIRS